jgi:uncharacterized protein with NRDE domain
MCTLVVASKVVPGYPLVVIANRDEMKDRASSPPMRWQPGGYLAPKDDVRGGTWLGLSKNNKVFVGITNRFLGPRDADRKSRGSIVTDALDAAASAEAIHQAMTKIDPTAYNGFHLVYADDKHVFATISDGTSLMQLSLGDGVSIVTERTFGDGLDKERVAKIRRAWSNLAVDFSLERATKLLTEHDDSDPMGATCIHLDALRYGTRSAMVLTFPESGASQMLWAEGPPCTTPFFPVSL